MTRWIRFGTSLWSSDTCVDATPGTASIAMALSPAMSAGLYGVRSLSLQDLAGNYRAKTMPR